MPDVKITIGNREFEVACAEGEEHFLQSAAAMLDNEAQVLVDQIRHLTESRMLLMAGLMLADKTAGMEDNLKIADKKIAQLEAELAEARAAANEAPPGVSDTLSELAARAEAIADQVDGKTG
ncbi:MAG: cell division protein ZapA [Maritimibacter harenae]|jgi:cell division protein ZapA|uniref:Cell division protein ZapA n=1 Tax=Maritimibacter harenae TaxID=2606218 RepID=A0A845LZ16_9RHOB|nr:cell division protein ZapA [Maritimibacter harenae]MZR13035.1 cell division protein ZapA [Maritimibacter harenae]